MNQEFNGQDRIRNHSGWEKIGKGIRTQEEIKESRALEKKRNDENDENRKLTESDRL